MANINVGLNPTNDPTYINAAKESSRHDFNNAGKYETLFADLSNIIKNGVEGAKNVVTGLIKDDVRYGYDKITGAQGVDTAVENPLIPLNIGGKNPEGVATPAGGEASSNNPMAANRPPEGEQDSYKNRIMRLQAAKAQGRIGDSYYYTQLEAMNRSIRAKYPGFRDEVDAMVQTITGVTPANALRKAINNDLDTAQSQSDAQQKAIQTLAKENAGYLSPQTMKKVAEGKATWGEVMLEVQPQKIAEQNMSLTRAKLATKKDMNAATSDDVLQSATELVNNMDAKLMNFTSVNGKSINSWLQDRIQELKEGKTLSPEDTAKISAEFLQMKQGYINGLREMWASPLAPGSKHTYESALNDPGKRKQFDDNAMQKFDNIEAALNHKNFGLLNKAANDIQTITDARTKSILEKYPRVAMTSALAKMPGMANVVQVIMTQNPNDYNKLQNEVAEAITMNNLTGNKFQKDGATSPTDDLDNFAKTPGGNTPAGMNRFLRDRAVELSNPSLPIELRAEAAKKMFAFNNSQYILKWSTPASKTLMFNTLTSPEVTRSMQEIGKTDPVVWDNYSKWAKNTFANSFKSVFDDVNNVNFRDWIDVKYDPGDNRFHVFPTPKGIEENQKYAVGVGGSIIRAIEDRKNVSVSAAVDKVNSMITQIEPILKASGFDPKKEIPNLTRNIKLQDTKNKTFWNSLLDASSTSDEGTAVRSFGGSDVNFTKPSDSEGRKYATDKLPTYDTVKAAFSDAESANDYNRLVTPKSGGVHKAPLTDMTVEQVLQYQSGMRASGFPSTATGKYQIIKGTLQSLVDEGVVKTTDKYSVENQEKLAEALLERRGMQKYLDGKLSLQQFMENLGNEWEAIKRFPDTAKKVMEALKSVK